MSYFSLCFAGEASKKSKNSKPKNTSKKNSKQDASSSNEQVVEGVVQEELTGEKESETDVYNKAVLSCSNK
jgi:hypothetical protein